MIKLKKLCIAIDGPASSGKSTIAKKIAVKYGLVYLDTGAMYRCMTLYCLQHHVDVLDEAKVIAAIKHQKISFDTIDGQQHVFLNQKDVTLDIRSAVVNANVSLVSSYELVRKELVLRQQNYIQDGGIIMDGRDIGTVVMPNAHVKIFMIASARERARRRFEENKAKGIKTASIEDLQKEIEARDLFDSTRDVTPLKKAKDAIEIDTTTLNIDEVVHKISVIIDNISYY